MDNFEVRDILKTFRILVDTREQNTQKAQERYESFGVPVERCVIDYGDYCANITLASGDLYDTSVRVRPACCVERKMSLDELAMCFTRHRDRFEREFIRASKAGAKIFLLVEGASWEAIINHRYRSQYHPNAMVGSIVAWAIRYGMTPIFCKSGTSGRVIKEILYRDIKERLENGEYG